MSQSAGQAIGALEAARDRLFCSRLCLGKSLVKMRAMLQAAPVTLVYCFYALIAWGLSSVFVAFRILSGESIKLGLALRAGVVVWLGVPTMLSLQGVFVDFGASPPHLMKVVVSMVILVTGFSFSPAGLWVAERLPTTFLVGLQGFRFPLEILLYALAGHALMPREMTFDGYNFDIVTGVLALVLWILVHKGMAPTGALWAFNCLGVALLLAVVTVAVLSFPEPFGWFDPSTVIVAYYPWVWLPTFLVQLALLGHLLLFRKLRLPPPPPRKNV